ncbi:MAG: TRAP transporter small permease [Hoeflea sp.]|uniref:TRAP transporter small permease n=1 Tax=Hoeflea sp. TaxID=1940281 RepID=UPI001D87E254|nr:TRAP transporter small permease [Hoeflea sp.]MBU4531168.1 TRAP transporter small permease [Alphaproteobacteria bacterium]MBU4545770.1 TRAP transporter small permease [Alphaproteobacteria bacterium]MBU4550739.1 TRAP transporter small permease [Alphaproteobacteria bacterium]MBV1724445.1 TRAP transporter small permease [Hoeflea sp.]MBV1760465.1 TRAP transporter small permease [Hoeflea sp.]
MPKPLQWLFKLFDILVVTGMSVMAVMVFWNVVLRYGFNSGIPFSVEVSRILFVWIVFLGSVTALAQGLHMSVDSLVARLPRKLRTVCFLISHGLMLWCCWLIWQGSWIQTLLNWNNRAPISGISVGTMYAAGLVASACMAVILLVNLWRSLRGELPATWSGKDRFADFVPDIKEKRQ